MCSDEVQILLDQMQNNPSKFASLFAESNRVPHPWAKALGNGNFELIDHVALRQQLKLLKGAYAKQLILEGLLAPVDMPTKIDVLLKEWSDGEPFPEKSQPSKIHMNKAQYDIAKKFADAEVKQKLKANLQKAAR